MNSERSHLFALAGLLHDIGKFALRAGEGATRTWDAEGKRDYRYKHALLTADFVERVVPAPWKTEVKLLAGNHHRPQREDDWIVTLADHLSAGERADAIDDEESRTVHPQQLLSIFSSVSAEDQRAKDAYLPLSELRLEEKALFPGNPLPTSDKVWQAYRGLWDSFTEKAAKLRDAHAGSGNLPVYVENLLLLCQSALWCVPSAYYRSRPDISLYDHSRMTAALAALLGDGDMDAALIRRLADKPDNSAEKTALLVGGDLSGVQDFLYTITARGAASALRGRSFYLQLVTEAAARYLLRRLDLPVTNLIYSGGGNFYLLARRTDGERLLAAQQEISRLLLQHHRGELYLAVAQEPLHARDFFDGGIGDAWRRLTERFQQAKRRRFSELPSELAWLFAPKGDGGNQDGQCMVCGAEHPQTQRDPDAVTADAPQGVRKCLACFSYEALGDQLRSARYLTLTQIEPAPADLAAPPGAWADVLAGLGMEAALSDVYKPESLPPDSPSVMLALSDAALDVLQPAANCAVGRRLLVNVTPILTAGDINRLRYKVSAEDLPRAGKVKPFGALAAESKGIERLGVLRMDVDDLGRLFGEGLNKRATLSRVASLSFAVSLYFEGWVGELAAKRNGEGPDKLYSIYSGGDDLFFVGAWDEIVELAREVRADLTRYAAHHPGIHASAGIALAGGKYPLYQAAHDAGRAEDAAKSLVWWEGDVERRKNAVCFLGKALPWPRFGLDACEGHMHSAHGLVHLLTAQTAGSDGEGNGAGNALIRRLSSLYTQYAAEEEARRKAGRDVNWSGRPQALWGPWMWRAVYTLSRLKHPDAPSLRQQLQEDEFRSMEWIGLAARWAELMVRARAKKRGEE